MHISIITLLVIVALANYTPPVGNPQRLRPPTVLPHDQPPVPATDLKGEIAVLRDRILALELRDGELSGRVEALEAKLAERTDTNPYGESKQWLVMKVRRGQVVEQRCNGTIRNQRASVRGGSGLTQTSIGAGSLADFGGR